MASAASLPVAPNAEGGEVISDTPPSGSFGEGVELHDVASNAEGGEEALDKLFTLGVGSSLGEGSELHKVAADAERVAVDSDTALIPELGGSLDEDFTLVTPGSFDAPLGFLSPGEHGRRLYYCNACCCYSGCSCAWNALACVCAQAHIERRLAHRDGR